MLLRHHGLYLLKKKILNSFEVLQKFFPFFWNYVFRRLKEIEVGYVNDNDEDYDSDRKNISIFRPAFQRHKSQPS